MVLTQYEANDLLWALEASQTGKDMLEYIESTIVGMTQPCCNFCKELDELDNPS